MARKRQFKKVEVLHSAKDLFWEQGFYATSMEDLVAKLSINRASMYNTFGSKTNLYHLALEKYIDEVKTQMEELFNKEENIRKGINDWFESIYDANTKKGCFVVNTTTELVGEDAVLDRSIANYQAAIRENFIRYLSFGVTKGQVSPYKNLESIADYFYTLLNGLQVGLKNGVEKNTYVKIVYTALSTLD